jgi:hypothetical protein
MVGKFRSRPPVRSPFATVSDVFWFIRLTAFAVDRYYYEPIFFRKGLAHEGYAVETDLDLSFVVLLFRHSSLKNRSRDCEPAVEAFMAAFSSMIRPAHFRRHLCILYHCVQNGVWIFR